MLLARDNVKVSASDISPLAVENTKFNAEKNNIKLERVLLSDVYDDFSVQYKFDAIYWDSPWLETIGHDKIDNILEYGLYDTSYRCLERFIEQTHLHLKPNGKLYLGHGNFGNYQRLESLLDKYDYKYKVITDEPSSAIPDVEYYLYEAQLKEKQNQIFISLPHTENMDIMENEKANYCKLAEEYNLKILESSFNIPGKDFDNMINRTISEIEKAQVLVVDLSEDSIKTGIEIAYAHRERCIPVVGFGHDVNKQFTGRTKTYFTKLVSGIEEAMEFSKDYCMGYRK